jgi:penicillin-binding protein 1C
VLVGTDGLLLGATVAADEQWRFPPSGSPLPDRYISAVVAFEDERFFAPPGVDPIAIARALRDNVRAGRVVSGGSTITMQLARILRGNRPRTLSQKIAEASLALRLELFWTKDRILSEFAARAPYGGNVVGFEAASWRFFGRPPRDVTWAEAALLAVLPNSPSLIHVSQRRDELQAKRDRLLERLRDEGQIDAGEYALARGEPIPSEPRAVPQLAPHLLQTLSAEYPDRWRFSTTLDPFLQRRSGELLEQFGRAGRSAGADHAAALVIEIETGAVRAYVGNLPPRSPAQAGDFVDIVQSRRSTGSLLKPFLYAAMVDSGELLPGQLLPDIPTRIGGYVPQNPDHTFSGAVRAEVALARSLNVPAAVLLRDYGVARFQGFLEDAGFTTFDRAPDEYGIPLILGGGESTLWELTGAYASLARTVLVRGPQARTFFQPHVIEPEMEPPDSGSSIGPARPDAVRSPVSPAAAFLTLQALAEVERPRELMGWRNFAGGGTISWKTGTSYGLRDAWAIGVSDRYAIGVWVGNATGAGAPGLRGTAIAGPMLFSLFDLVGTGRGFTSPGGMQTVRVCADSGLLAGPDCRETTTALAPDTAHGHEVCPYCRTIHLNAERTRRVSSSVYPVSEMVHEKWFILPPTVAWYYEQRAADYVAPPPFDPRLLSPVNPISIAFPLPDARVYVPLEMTGKRGSLVATVHHEAASARLFWHLDGIYLGSTTGEHEMEISPAPGTHELAVVDESGNSARVSFAVLGRE